MSRLTRDGTAEPVSRDQTLRRKQNTDMEIFIFPVQMAMRRIGNLTRLIHTLAMRVTIHTIRLVKLLLNIISWFSRTA